MAGSFITPDGGKRMRRKEKEPITSLSRAQRWLVIRGPRVFAERGKARQVEPSAPKPASRQPVRKNGALLPDFVRCLLFKRCRL
jgi:hypothetical protein